MAVTTTSSHTALDTLACPNCGEVFTDPDVTECPYDGAKLTSDANPQTLVDRVVGGRYRIITRLGEGGMGTVYAAEHTLSLRRVALKIIRPELESSRLARERFLRECKTLERVQSANVVQVLEAGESAAGEIYLVMELLEGETLGDRIARGALAVEEALGIATQICAALRAAHGKDVVHRDLKPDNVFLCVDGTVRVLDFGIARLVHDTRDGDAGARKLTRTGSIVGTPAYISPEGAAGEDVGPAADLYSLGVMLFEMLAGELPFRETQPVLLMGMHLKDPAPSLRAVRPDLALPGELVALVERLLSKRPVDRPASAEAVLDTIESVLAAMRAPAAPAITRELAVVEKPRRVRSSSPLVWMAIAAGVGTIALVAVLAIVLWPEPPPSPPPAAALPTDPPVAPIAAEPIEAPVVEPPAAELPADPVAPVAVEELPVDEADPAPVEVTPEPVAPRPQRSRREQGPRRGRNLVRDYF